MMGTRDQLIAAGIRNLKEFGYPGVTADNITTDAVYRHFFRSMLLDHAEIPEAVALVNEIDELDDEAV